MSPLAAEGLLRAVGGYDPAQAREEIALLVERVEADRTSVDPAAEEVPGKQPSAAAGRLPHPFYGCDTAQGIAELESIVEALGSEERGEIFAVYVLGGSVGAIFQGPSRGGTKRLVEMLEGHPAMRGRAVTIYGLARAGAKQPQHLGKLAFLLAQGAAPDLVINLDGLNEMRGGMGQYRTGRSLPFPTAAQWDVLVGEERETEASRDRLLELLLARRNFLTNVGDLPRSWMLSSAILGGLARRGAQRHFRTLLDAEEGYIQSLAPKRIRPLPSMEGEQAALQHCVNLWAESSVLMHALCRGKSIPYLHILQPTLHDPGAKILSDRERELGVGPGGFDPSIAEYYGLLRARGADLAVAGVPFVDASRIFAGVSETLYHDRAHFGREGNRMLAEFLAQQVWDRL